MEFFNTFILCIHILMFKIRTSFSWWLFDIIEFDEISTPPPLLFVQKTHHQSTFADLCRSLGKPQESSLRQKASCKKQHEYEINFTVCYFGGNFVGHIITLMHAQSKS